jgi:transcriptional regulator with XRE-family HTH domain
MTQNEPRAPSWYAAENIRAWRGKESQERLARRVADLGVTMNRSILANIESHRREEITVEEVFAFALALNVSPTNLVLPRDEETEVAVTPTVTEWPFFVRLWIYGERRLAVTDENQRQLDLDFQRRAPEHELRQRDEKVRSHPLTMAVSEMQGLIQDSVLGPRELVSREHLAEGLRRTAKKVATHADLLADEVEQSDTDEKGHQS